MFKRVMTAFVFTASSVCIAPIASASVIKIDDLTDTITVTVDGVDARDAPSVTNFSINGETVSFDFTSSAPAGAHAGVYYFSMDGGVGSSEKNTLSDEGMFTLTNGSPIIGIQFASDPDTLTIPVNAIFLGSFHETGAFQEVAQRLRSNDTVFVRSDVETPEPSSLALLGLALLSLVGFGMMRRRSDA